MKEYLGTINRTDLTKNARVEMAVLEGQKLTRMQFFREDVVRSVTNSSFIGMVAKVGGDSYSSSSSSDDEDEENEEESNVCEGSARVCWIDADEATEQLSDIRVVDRYFSHGDVVASASDPLGQTGTVTRVDILADLEFPNGEVATSVSGRSLRRVRSFVPGDYVVHGQRLGRVDEIMDHVTVLFDDGAKCKVLKADPERLVPKLKAALGDSGCPYYPGLRVRATSSGVFRGARWLRGKWRASRKEGIVANVETASVLVYWIASANLLEISQALVLSEQQDPGALVPLTHFSHTNWQLGDRSLLPRDLKSRDYDSEAGGENDLPSSASEKHTTLQGTDNSGALMGELQQNNWAKNRKTSRVCSVKCEKRKLKKKESEVEIAALITNTRTMIDVTWQDGSRSLDISACSLIPVGHPVDHDFWPEQYVLERGSDGEEINTQVRRIGIVKSVDSKRRIAKVRWFKPVLGSEALPELDAEETVSVYELIEHPDFNYCLADVVIRLSLASDTAPDVAGEVIDDSDARSSLIDGLSEHEGQGNEAESSEKQRAVRHRDQKRRILHSGDHDLSWVGVITGLKDGEIEVAWANGMVSKVGPQAIFVVSRDDDELSTLTSDAEDVDDAASWETVDSPHMNELDQYEQLKETSWSPKVSWEPSIESESAIECERETQIVGETSEGHIDDLMNENKDNFVEKRIARYGGPFRFPLAAIGFIMSRFAGSLLGLKGKRKISDVNGAQSNAASHAKKLNNQQGFNDEILTAKQGSGNLQQVSQLHPSVTDIQDIPNTSIQVQDYYGESIDAEIQKEKDIIVTGSEIRSISEVETTNKLITAEMDYKPDFEEEDDDSVVENFEKSEPSTGSFRQFDIVIDAKDHYYYSKEGQASCQREWFKKIQQEWNILEKGLPDKIFVRVFEERMDLLRAVIVGAAGTPYHDGLFVFDIYLPPEYPSVPPEVYYQSGGLRLNPNLYENGKVCLSLLNTWAGKGVEVWNTSSSSILQVLVSIQGLVLNSKPYFNEAGYDRQVDTAEGERNSLVYNENSFLLSCKSMLYLLHQPPKHFEKLIQDHFKSSGSHILSACQAYLSGTLVGSFAETGNDSIYCSSEGFKLMLTKLVPKLATAFAEVGAFCEDSSYGK